MQQVLQFAHVAIQRRGGDLGHLPRRQADHRRARICRDARQQRLAQRGQVFAPLAQRRHHDLDHVETVEQVLAKTPGLHFGRQVLVRGADDAHVHRFFLRVAERPHAPLLNRAQQLGLHGQWQIADFVKKQSAATRGLEEAFTVLRGAGVRAFAGAEKLGFQQVLGDRAAVHGHEGAA